MPTFFATAAEFGAWLKSYGTTESEVLLGYYKRATGRPTMTWPESVDEALCHGWIDGVRTRIDEHSYKIRFTPRKPTSTWSAINIDRVHALENQGRMTDAGRKAFALRRETRSKTYSYEQSETATLDRKEEAQFRRNRKAWKFFVAQPPAYRNLVTWWIISAKRQATRAARLARLIEASENGQRL